MPTSHPQRLTLNGVPWWVVDGRLVPVLAGGDDGDPPKTDPPGTGDPPKTDPPKTDPPANDGEPKNDDDAGKARREAADLRKRLRETEEERDRLKSSQMSDTERQEARVKAAEEKASGLETSLRTAHLTVAVNRHAKDFGIVDPALAAKLLDGSKVSYDDQHQPEAESVKAALKAVVEEHSILTRAGDSDGGRRGPATPTGAEGMNDWIRQRVSQPPVGAQ